MNILLVDDDSDSRTCVGEFLRELGHEVDECGNGQDAITLFFRGNYSMVLSDICMPKLSGIDLLQTIMSQVDVHRSTDIILFTGNGDMETAIAALRAGATDYLLKPIDIEQLAAITERIALKRDKPKGRRVFEDNSDQTVKEAIETGSDPSTNHRMTVHSAAISGIGVFSESMRTIVQSALKFHTDRTIPVLIEGETGTGKEMIARLIHFGSIEESAPFIDINCAALTPSLFESELFGYEGGAFTGGLTKGQKGKLDLAQGGTLFLDEVGELPLELQSKLLRVLQEKEYYRVGGLKKIHTDIRIIGATNVNLDERVAAGKFRKDLYYRLNVGTLLLPPLRQRTDDVVPLARMLLQRAAKQKKKRFKGITEEAARILIQYTWPGNVRELQNTMEWVAFMYDDAELQPEHLLHISIPGKTDHLEKTITTAGASQPPKPSKISKISKISKAINHGNPFDLANPSNPSNPITPSTPNNPTIVSDLGNSVDSSHTKPSSVNLISPEHFTLPEKGIMLEEYVDNIVLQALTMHKGNKTETARYLGISRRSLYCRLERIRGKDETK
ncbi:sigma-54-dependent transcriptional regulator [Heliobacterium chlorum]|uniref:sigma-54-dependent transcriptional regulator n=1 Tax=Heliobacterium chlorum TaxID=2698 RepID=UPI001A9B36E7|nr:sigma-54 dependent transcriptional regulator [Heliobacterium chlorum]